MTDGLTTIDTANLTAAMKHVYQRPLNDGVVTTTSCKFSNITFNLLFHLSPDNN